MSNTYKVDDALKLAKTMAKGVPFTGVDLSICDIVNSTIYKAYPWRDSLKLFTPISLVDGTQDYVTGLSDIFRITQFWVSRTDTSPNQVRDLRVAKNITIDLVPKSPYAVRAASFQGGKFRLESAVQVPSGTTWTLGGEYQPDPTRVSDLQDPFWFDDAHLEVFAKGLTYWAYRLSDDQRAGASQFVDGRPPVYTGALAEFMGAIDAMAASEDFGNIDGYYPDESLGTVDQRRYYSSDVYPLL